MIRDVKKTLSRYSQMALEALCILFFVFTPFLSPQSQAQSKKRPAIQKEVSVVLKLIHVYVSDKKGNPITDLEKEDFILYDNGQQKPITDFEKHIPLREDITEEVIPTDVVPSSRLNRKFFFLFDISQNDFRGLIASKKTALTFLKTQVLPTDEVAVLIYSIDKGLRLLEYLTTNHGKVVQKIEDIKDVPGQGMEENSGDYELPYARVYLGAGYESLLVSVNPFKDRLMEMTTHFMESLKDLSKSLRNIAGFKNIIFFSMGTAETLLYDAEDPKVRQSFKEMLKELSSTGCPIFTVNADPIKKKGGGQRGDHTLKQMARVSGGKYFSNIEQSKTIAKSIHDTTSHYYVLGYVIDDEWDGKFHKIRVEVKRPGYEIFTQAGYFNPKPFSEWSEFEKKLQLLDLAESDNPHLITPEYFPVSSYSLIGQKSSFILFMAEISKDTLPEIFSHKAELIFLILDKNNTIVESTSGEIVLASILLPSVYLYDITNLPPGDYRYRLVLRNPSTGEAARGETSVVVSEPPVGGIKLSTPFLFTTKDETAYLKLQKSLNSKKETEDKDASLLRKILPFVSNKAAPVIFSLDGHASILYGIIQCVTSGEREPELEFDAALIYKEIGQKIQLNGFIRAVEKLEGIDILLMEFPLPDLKPGTYNFFLAVEDKINHLTAETFKEFKLIK